MSHSIGKTKKGRYNVIASIFSYFIEMKFCCGDKSSWSVGSQAKVMSILKNVILMTKKWQLQPAYSDRLSEES